MMIEAPNFTAEQLQHVALMRRIAQQVTAETNDNFVLKGGTALLLAYGLPRYSTDLDFDGKRAGTDLTRSIRTGATATDATEVVSLSLKKNTPTTKRYMLHYTGPLPSRPLKIEASFRDAASIEEDDVAVVNGIRVYKIGPLAHRKIGAFLNRTTARDVFDVWFLLRQYPDEISATDLGAVEQKVQQLGEDALREIIESDEILDQHDLDRVTLELVEALQRIQTQRAEHPSQDAPSEPET